MARAAANTAHHHSNPHVAQQQRMEHEKDYSNELIEELDGDIQALKDLRQKAALVSKYAEQFCRRVRRGELDLDAFQLAPETFTLPGIDNVD